MKYFIYIYFFLKGIYHTNSWDFKYVSCRWGIFLEEELDHLCKDSCDLQVFWDSRTLGKQVCLNKNILSVPCFPGSDVRRQQQVFYDQLSNARVRGLGPDTIPGANTPVPQNNSTQIHKLRLLTCTDVCGYVIKVHRVYTYMYICIYGCVEV